MASFLPFLLVLGSPKQFYKHTRGLRIPCGTMEAVKHS